MKIKVRNIFRFVEFLLLFFGVPLYIYFDPDFIHPSAIVLPVILIIILYLRKVPDFKFRDLVFFKPAPKQLLNHVIIVVSVAVILLLAVFLFDRENLFNLPRANLKIFIFLAVFYPLFSAYGQEIIYRTFIFYRYRSVFKTKLAFILAGSIAFSFVHIVYFSYISLILTFIMGLYLSTTYLKTRSVLLTSILHGILGDLVFAIGLGSYFWLDMHRWM